jgi:hypothetical protein
MAANITYPEEKTLYQKAKRKKQARDEDQCTDQYIDLAESMVNKE